MEASSDVLGKALDAILLRFLDILLLETWQHMLLVQAVEIYRLRCYGTQNLRHLVLYIDPPRREQVHFDDSVTFILECTRGHETTSFFRLAAMAGEVVGAGSIEPSLLGWMMSVRLSVGDVAVKVPSQQRN